MFSHAHLLFVVVSCGWPVKSSTTNSHPTCLCRALKVTLVYLSNRKQPTEKHPSHNKELHLNPVSSSNVAQNTYVKVLRVFCWSEPSQKCWSQLKKVTAINIGTVGILDHKLSASQNHNMLYKTTKERKLRRPFCFKYI